MTAPAIEKVGGCRAVADAMIAQGRSSSFGHQPSAQFVSGMVAANRLSESIVATVLNMAAEQGIALTLADFLPLKPRERERGRWFGAGWERNGKVTRYKGVGVVRALLAKLAPPQPAPEPSGLPLKFTSKQIRENMPAGREARAVAQAFLDHFGVFPSDALFRAFAPGCSFSVRSDAIRLLRNPHSGCLPKTRDSVLEAFSQLWPDDLPWPADVPRPSPRADGDAS